LVDAELISEVRPESIARAELLNDFHGELLIEARLRKSAPTRSSSARGRPASSRVSRATSARSASRWELTDTYSPTAIDIDPATSPATPATRMASFEGRGRRDTDEKT
jgi:hypothetical protein